MLKNSLIFLALIVLLAQMAVLASPVPVVVYFASGISLLAAIGLIASAFRLKSTVPPTKTDAPAATPAPPTPASAPTAATESLPLPRAEAEIVAFLALLQEKARLVDFAQESISGASDAQIGAAARIVHAGCQKVFADYLEIGPVTEQSEGATIKLEAGYDTHAYRLLGKVPDQPPYSGKLLHPGWQVSSVKLPRIAGITPERPWPVIAPAEVESTLSE